MINYVDFRPVNRKLWCGIHENEQTGVQTAAIRFNALEHYRQEHKIAEIADKATFTNDTFRPGFGVLTLQDLFLCAQENTCSLYLVSRSL